MTKYCMSDSEPPELVRSGMLLSGTVSENAGQQNGSVQGPDFAEMRKIRWDEARLLFQAKRRIFPVSCAPSPDLAGKKPTKPATPSYSILTITKAIFEP